MREVRISCKDDKTGYQVLLTETSYNFACDWLDRVVKEEGREICRCFHNDETGLTEIWTCWFDEEINNYRPDRHFFYDEERGYLLGE